MKIMMRKGKITRYKKGGGKGMRKGGERWKKQGKIKERKIKKGRRK